METKIEYNKIIQGDCLEYMRQLPDKSIDLIVTDPPYGKKADKGTNGFGQAKNRRYAGGWDNKRPEKEVFDEMRRISKNMVIFGANYFADMLPSSNCWIFWDKKGEVKFQNPFADGELIYTTFKKPVKRIVFRQQGFITDSKDERYHPTQKPSELVAQLIEMFSDEGGIIFDPFIGSGTTAIAAIRTGRKYIGCEINEEFWQICEERIKKEKEESEKTRENV
nr:MAG TPA: adenine-specific methyltransferase [Caudoviricetes sp.]